MKPIYWVLLILVVIASFIAFKKEAHGDVYPNWITIDHPDTCLEAAKIIFEDAPIMLKVMIPESRGNHLAKNPKSTAKGCYQILDSTWNSPEVRCKGKVLEPIPNVQCAKKLHDLYGTKPWLESKHIWSKM